MSSYSARVPVYGRNVEALTTQAENEAERLVGSISGATATVELEEITPAEPEPEDPQRRPRYAANARITITAP